MLDLPYLDRLALAGVRPDDVTHVINTHLHVDHVGWNTGLAEGRWVPTFPKARYIFGVDELGHVRRPTLAAEAPETVPVIEDSVLPVVEAASCRDGPVGRRAHCPASPSRPFPATRWASSRFAFPREERARCSAGDVFHQPMQIVRPLWNSRFCENQDVARATRAHLLDAEADRGTMIFPSHFGTPHAGSIVRHGSGYRFVPLTTAA